MTNSFQQGPEKRDDHNDPSLTFPHMIIQEKRTPSIITTLSPFYLPPAVRRSTIRLVESSRVDSIEI